MSLINKNVIVIGGPTASGKTAIAVHLAKQLQCSIISADSRQIYKEMAIGTAKPSLTEMDGIPHYFIDSHSIQHELSAGRFAEEARVRISDLLTRDDYVIIVGGSGLFIKALVEGMDELPGDLTVRNKWNDLFNREGIVTLQDELQRLDPDYFTQVDLSNPMRLIRALEVIELTGKPFSILRTGSSTPLPYPVSYFIINHDRELLYDRIHQRVDQMMENGFLAEVKALLPFQSKQSLNTVGYKELFAYFNQEISFETAIALIKQNTRRYAKRQITWFRGIDQATWIENKTTEEAVASIISAPFFD